MNTPQIMVNVFAIILMIAIVWYFWLYKPTVSEIKSEVKEGIQEIEVTVKGGYQPAAMRVKVGTTLRLNITRRESSTCGEEIIFSDFGQRVHLPEGKTVTVELRPEKVGEYDYHCAMGMYRGKLLVEAAS